jgi:hypothetical protein
VANQKYVCIRCDGEKCLHCGGRGWLTEGLVQVEQKRELIEAVAKIMVKKRIAALGQEDWSRRAAEANLTVDQYTEVQIWQATGPLQYQFMSLTNEVIDALADLAGIEVPPVFLEDRPEFNVIG